MKDVPNEVSKCSMPKAKTCGPRLDNSFIIGLLYAVCIVEGADIQLLPSTFRALEADLGLSPTDLATLGLCQALAASLTTPVWGILVDNGCSGKRILVCGSIAWAILTLLLAFVTHFHAMLVLRTLNGIALASLTPVSQAIIVSITPPAERGARFGMCGGAMNLGMVLCSVFATSMSNTVVFGLDGWRVAFTVVSMVSLSLAFVLATCMEDIRHQDWRATDLYNELRTFLSYFKIPSFVIIVCQGCLGSVPWSSLAFLTMFFQYIGIPDNRAALLYAVMLVALGLGHIVGGHIGDGLTKISRFHGRPLTAQISVLCGIPCVWLMLGCVPRQPSSWLTYALLLTCFGITASWCSSGVNRPIFTEVVPSGSQGRVIAWLAALEGSSAACFGGPMVGLLAETTFGYRPQQEQVQDIDPSIREANVHALASGMLFMAIMPWIACFAIFSFLHLTYRCDVQRLELEQKARAPLSAGA